jgi:hypothetical protein
VDTCGVPEINAFRLNEPDSSYWNTCINISDELFYPVLRYLGEYQTEAFNKIWDVKLFRQYNKIYVSSGDSIELYGHSFILMKGIGIYYTEYGESGSVTLEGAIIKGIKYGTVVGVNELNDNKSQSFVLHQNYPNPFNPSTTIRYDLPISSFIRLSVYNILGEEIKRLEEDYKNPGSYEAIFDASQLPSGIYVFRLATENYSSSKKMILNK